MAQRKNILSLLSKIDPDIAENVRLEEVPGGFVNLTSYAVGDQMAALLSYGPRFLLPRDATIPEVFSGFGELHLQLGRHLGLSITGPMFLELLEKYKEEKDKLFSMRQPSLMEAAIRSAVVDTKEFFRQQPQACIVQSDKGNKTCLMTLADYDAKMETYVQKCIAKGVYHLTTERRVNAVGKIFKDLREALLSLPIPSDESELRKLFECLKRFHNVKLPHLYGNVKCHKPDAPVRPICSTVAWYSRPIQRILHYILKRHLSDVLCKQNVQRITEVAKEVAAIKPITGFVFTKLDVTDMYGSMDKRRIFMLLERILERIEAEGKSILPKAIVIRLVRFSLEQSCLIGYNNQVYIQKMGLPQGACDSGYLATIYLDYVLQLHYEELFIAHRVKYWAKYMDDFLLYLPSQNITHFKQRMQFLTGLKFEIEPEEKLTEGVYHDHGIIRTIPFLDIYIHTTKQGKYIVSNYRKPTASLRMIHALSNTINAYKINTMYSFLNNLFSRTSTPLLAHDMNTLYHRMLVNGYSHNFTECIFYKAIHEELQKMRRELREMSEPTHDNKQQVKATVDKYKERMQLLRDYQSQFSLDLKHHYKTIRDQYVSTSKQSGYRFQYRSVSLSRLVFTACQYAHMPPPVYCRAENSDVFRKYLGHKRIKEAMDAVNRMPASGDKPMHFSIGMLRCVTCAMIFIVSGRDKLHVIVEQEFRRQTSEIYEHQVKFQHTISPAVQVLRPVEGIDTAYLCQLYLAIYHTMGMSTSDRFALSSLPSFVRTMLYILRGAPISHQNLHNGEKSSTWLTQAVPYLPRFYEQNIQQWTPHDVSFPTPALQNPIDETLYEQLSGLVSPTPDEHEREKTDEEIPIRNVCQPQEKQKCTADSLLNTPSNFPAGHTHIDDNNPSTATIYVDNRATAGDTTYWDSDLDDVHPSPAQQPIPEPLPNSPSQQVTTHNIEQEPNENSQGENNHVVKIPVDFHVTPEIIIPHEFGIDNIEQPKEETPKIRATEHEIIEDKVGSNPGVTNTNADLHATQNHDKQRESNIHTMHSTPAPYPIDETSKPAQHIIDEIPHSQAIPSTAVEPDNIQLEFQTTQNNNTCLINEEEEIEDFSFNMPLRTSTPFNADNHVIKRQQDMVSANQSINKTPDSFMMKSTTHAIVGLPTISFTIDPLYEALYASMDEAQRFGVTELLNETYPRYLEKIDICSSFSISDPIPLRQKTKSVITISSTDSQRTRTPLFSLSDSDKDDATKPPLQPPHLVRPFVVRVKRLRVTRKGHDEQRLSSPPPKRQKTG